MELPTHKEIEKDCQVIFDLIRTYIKENQQEGVFNSMYSCYYAGMSKGWKMFEEDLGEDK